MPEFIHTHSLSLSLSVSLSLSLRFTSLSFRNAIGTQRTQNVSKKPMTSKHVNVGSTHRSLKFHQPDPEKKKQKKKTEKKNKQTSSMHYGMNTQYIEYSLYLYIHPIIH